MRFPTVVLGCSLLTAATLCIGAFANAPSRTITWSDAAPLHPRLESHGITASSFGARVADLRRANARRVREGDLDHLIFYLLQSGSFTKLPSIEPALSAKAFTDSGRVPNEAEARIAAFEKALNSATHDPRLSFFRGLAAASFPKGEGLRDALRREYQRVMRFVYEKEFAARRSGHAEESVRELYRTRGLSTDTAIESGYLVYQGLGILKSLEPERRIRRVLIVGPGLDLAPRTALIEAGPPESYQPWAVIDALVGLGLARPDELQVVGADINPRVVEHLRNARVNPPTLTLVAGIRETATVKLTGDYLEYFERLGSSIGESQARPGPQKRVRVRPDVATRLTSEQLDITAERLGDAPFDLVIATNVLPYFGEVELMLAMSNINAMLAPGGVFLHNEPRASLGEITSALGLSLEQSRNAVIATVRGAPGPLVDVVFLHKKASRLPASGFQPGGSRTPDPGPRELQTVLGSG